MVIVGDRNSGKTALGKIYRSLHHEAGGNQKNCAHLLISNACDKSKWSFLQKLNHVLAFSDRHSLTAKLNYTKNIVFVDDLNMNMGDERSETQLISTVIESIISAGIVSLKNVGEGKKKGIKRYAVSNTKFIITQNELNEDSDHSDFHMLENHTIRCMLGCLSSINMNLSGSGYPPIKSNNQQLELSLGRTPAHIRSIFIEILKANIIDDSGIAENLPANLMNITFDIYNEISYKIRERHPKVAMPLQYVKYLTTMVSRLRLKYLEGPNPVNTDFDRYWAFLVKDQLESFGEHYGISFK